MASKKYKHYSQISIPDEWNWPNFAPAEIACRGTGEIIVNTEALDKLQKLRSAVGKPMIINSAYRSASHNKKVGGAPNSVHMTGGAFDVSMANHDVHEFEQLARACGFTGFGYYVDQDFMHIDIGPARTWGTPWPKSETKTVYTKEQVQVSAPKIAALTVAGTAPIVASAGDFLGTFDTDIGKISVILIAVAVAGIGYWLYSTGKLFKRVR